MDGLTARNGSCSRPRAGLTTDVGISPAPTSVHDGAAAVHCSRRKANPSRAT